MKRGLGMKRRMMIAAALLFALALGAGLWFVRGMSPLDAGEMQMDEGKDAVTAYGQLDEDGTLKIEQTFYLTNRTGAALEEIVLRLYANASASSAVKSLEASINGDPVGAKIDEDDATLVTIARPWAKDEEIDLTLWTEIQTDLDEGIAVVALPVLASFRQGQWQTELFDPLAGRMDAPQMNGYSDIRYPQGWKAVSADGARGLTLAVSKNACVRWREIGGVAVSAMADDVFAANRLLDCAKTALESLEAIGLSYPFASLSIADAQPICADGDVYSGMIVLQSKGKKEELIQRMTRLIAAQTFGALVGNDAWNAPWLSRSLSSAAELIAYRHRKGQTAFQARFEEEIEIASRITRPYGVTVGADIRRFGGDAEMTQVLRDQGGAMLLGIEQAIGEEAFMAALRLYIEENAGGFADRAALERALETAGGGSWSGYLEDELND